MKVTGYFFYSRILKRVGLEPKLSPVLEGRDLESSSLQSTQTDSPFIPVFTQESNSSRQLEPATVPHIPKGLGPKETDGT